MPVATGWPENVLAVFGLPYLERLRRQHGNPYRRTGVAAWLLADDPVGRVRLGELDLWLAAARRHDLLDRDAMRRLKRGQVFVFLPKVLEFAALHFFEGRLGLPVRPGSRADFEVRMAPGWLDVEVKSPITASPAAFRRLVHEAGKRAKAPTAVWLVSLEVAPGFEAQAAARALADGRPRDLVVGVGVLRLAFGAAGPTYAHAFAPTTARACIDTFP
ncbi:MAG TPA: hypothetical protein VFI25_03850 [Planctomycetota bacterium]|jgi:hypothetical protein|nr:hypothetical protein [Planctomycetota bacterium]